MSETVGLEVRGPDVTPEEERVLEAAREWAGHRWLHREYGVSPLPGEDALMGAVQVLGYEPCKCDTPRVFVQIPDKSG